VPVCFGKRMHGTRKKAKRHRRLLAARTGQPKGSLSVYWCEQCQSYHVGHHRLGRTYYRKGSEA